ncbi:hypothetical protein BG005_005843 [Podila minutissima]|nr:hypothetical protein BG005_005843 [Podila minutissima]
MAPVNSSVPTRTLSTRIRQATSIQTASGQQGRTSSSNSNSNSNSNNSPSTPSNTARDTTERSRDARGPGRPRKEPAEPVPEAHKPTKPRRRGRPPKNRDPTTDSSDASSSGEDEDEDASPRDSPRTKQADLARKAGILELAKGQKSKAQGSPSSSSSRIERNGSNITKEDAKSTSRASSDEDDDDDDDDSDKDDKRPKELKEGAPSKRRLRSSRVFEPNDDQDGDDTTYTPDQQRLKEKVSAAEALSRVLRDNIHDPDSFHPDSVDAEDYELIQNTFGDIEDLNLNLNLTGHMSATDDSSGEDDQLTRELKRKHRQAKGQLTDTTTEFVDARRRLLLKKSADLDTEEAQIRAGTHPSLLSELNAIEERRKSKLGVVAARKSYHRESINSTFKATLKAAHDQYTEGQVTARKTMVDLVQNRINRIKQEIIQDSRTKAFFAQRSLAASLKRREALWEDDDECHDSCSSYDSYSSSGSECSDCEVCELSYDPSNPPYPRGLSRREAEADIAYLYQDRDLSVTKRNQGLLRSQALMAVVDKEHQRIAMADKEKERLDKERERLEKEREQIENEREQLGNERERRREPSDRLEQDKVERKNPSERHEDKEKEKDKEKDKDKGERKEPADRYNEEWRQVMEDRNRAPQQYFIDHLNEEKRRKRRVEDRELQTKSAHQKLMDSSKAPVRPKDEPMDLDQDVVLEEGSSRAPLRSPELVSRPYKSLLGNGDTDRKPRFVPGFGPEGLEALFAVFIVSNTSIAE